MLKQCSHFSDFSGNSPGGYAGVEGVEFEANGSKIQDYSGLFGLSGGRLNAECSMMKAAFGADDRGIPALFGIVQLKRDHREARPFYRAAARGRRTRLRIGASRRQPSG